MRKSISLSLALVGGLVATAALAQQPAPPPPPPPPGAHVRLDREANGVVRVDVHCAQQDTTKDCAAIASRLLADTTAVQSGK